MPTKYKIKQRIEFSLIDTCNKFALFAVIILIINVSFQSKAQRHSSELINHLHMDILITS